MSYDSFREMADSWGLLYMFLVFLLVFASLFLPGSKRRAQDAASIPLRDETPLDQEATK